MGIVATPVLALRNIGPSADKGEPRGERIDVAIGAVDAVNLAGNPVFWQRAAFMEVAINCREQVGVLLMADAAKIGNAADIPQKAHR